MQGNTIVSQFVSHVLSSQGCDDTAGDAGDSGVIVRRVCFACGSLHPHAQTMLLETALHGCRTLQTKNRPLHVQGFWRTGVRHAGRKRRVCHSSDAAKPLPEARMGCEWTCGVVEGRACLFFVDAWPSFLACGRFPEVSIVATVV